MGLTIESTEPVHVKLPLEGFVFRLMKEPRHDVLRKDCGFVYTEGLPVGVPRNNIIESSTLRVFEHLM